VFRCVPLCCAVFRCVPLCCAVLHCVPLCSAVLRCVWLCCAVFGCVALCCAVLLCVALCCTVLRCVPLFTYLSKYWRVMIGLEFLTTYLHRFMLLFITSISSSFEPRRKDPFVVVPVWATVSISAVCWFLLCSELVLSVGVVSSYRFEDWIGLYCQLVIDLVAKMRLSINIKFL
jgi:hypothetical protein